LKGSYGVGAQREVANALLHPVDVAGACFLV
jgi:hypothetical protein